MKKQKESLDIEENPKTSLGSAANKTRKSKKLTLEEKQAIRLKQHEDYKEANKKFLETRSEKNFYCTNKQLMAELEKWRDSNPDNPEERVMSDDLCRMIQYIARKLTNHSNFIRYTQDLKDEMISYATYKIVKGLPRYNFKFSNPFSYITQGCWNSFLIVLRKHYKQMNIKRELIKDSLSKIEATKEFNSKNLYNYLTKQFLGEVDQEEEQ